jgi:RNA polymerase sigma-70 factor (ECF subfamily)
MIDLVNDRQWFKTVFDENYIYIRNYIFYLSGDMVLAEDLCRMFLCSCGNTGPDQT